MPSTINPKNTIGTIEVPIVSFREGQIKCFAPAKSVFPGELPDITPGESLFKINLVNVRKTVVETFVARVTDLQQYDYDSEGGMVTLIFAYKRVYDQYVHGVITGVSPILAHCIVNPFGLIALFFEGDQGAVNELIKEKYNSFIHGSTQYHRHAVSTITKRAGYDLLTNEEVRYHVVTILWGYANTIDPPEGVTEDFVMDIKERLGSMYGTIVTELKI